MEFAGLPHPVLKPHPAPHRIWTASRAPVHGTGACENIKILGISKCLPALFEHS